MAELNKEIFDDFESLNPESAPPAPDTPVAEMPAFGTPASLRDRSLESVEKPAEAAPEAPPPTQEESQVKGQKARREMVRRINTLFAQGKEMQAQRDEAQDKVVELERRLADLERRPAYGPSVGTSSVPPVSAFDTTSVPTAGAFDPRLIASVVQEAVRPFAERLEQQEKVNQIADAQERVWGELEAEYPEITQPNSELRYATQHILDRELSFRANPQGPRYALLMARGLLSDQRPARREEAKRQAGTVVSGGGPEEGREVVAIRKELTAIANRPETGLRDFARVQSLKAKLAGLRGIGE